MRCYNCGCRISEHDFCTNCGVDVSIYKKIMMLSNRFYNEGLEKASVRDLSGAVNSLRQSLKFNKNNVEARNLLGLVYFEMGEVVAALSEWVISKNLRPKKNLADTYIDMIQNSQSKLESINQTIKKYNQAYEYCLQDSKDLAIIQLKKVISMNPNFIRAHQLLALLYIDAEEWAKAERELRRCERIDAGNTLTKRYLKEVDIMLHPEEGETRNSKKKTKKEEEQEPIRYVSGNETIIQPFDVKEPKGVSFSSIVYLLIGLAIGAGVAISLILPARILAAKAEVNDQLKVVSEQLSAKAATVEELEQKVADLENTKAELDEQLQNYVGNDGTLQNLNDMLGAVSSYLMNPEDVDSISAYLESIQSEVVIEETSEEFQNTYNALLAVVGPQVAVTYYEDGIDALKKEMFADAVANLSKAAVYDGNNIDVIYNLANAYYKSGDKEHAAEYYQKVVDGFEGTERARKSAQYLEEINSQ